MTVRCQHCDEPAPSRRTFCPSCHKRLRPTALPDSPLQPAAPTSVSLGPTTGGFGTAALLASAVAVAGVFGWVLLAEAVHLRSALVALAVAAGAAGAFRRHAPTDRRAPYLVVGLTVASALLGLLASQYALLAQAVHVGFFTAVAKVPVAKVPRLLTVGTTPLTWVIVGLSVYSGYRYSVRLRPPAPLPAHRAEGSG